MTSPHACVTPDNDLSDDTCVVPDLLVKAVYALACSKTILQDLARLIILVDGHSFDMLNPGSHYMELTTGSSS